MFKKKVLFENKEHPFVDRLINDVVSIDTPIKIFLDGSKRVSEHVKLGGPDNTLLGVTMSRKGNKQQ